MHSCELMSIIDDTSLITTINGNDPFVEQSFLRIILKCKW